MDVAKNLAEEQDCDPACETNNGSTLIHAACENCHLDVANYLAEEQYCDSACKDNDGWTLVHAACQNGHLDVVKISTIILVFYSQDTCPLFSFTNQNIHITPTLTR